jgi:hypothetical protein
MAILRKLYPSPKTLQPNLVNIFGKVAIGASGAVGTATGKGFTVTRTGAGLYTITIDANVSVPAILYCDPRVVFATAGNTQQAHVLSLDAANKKVTLQCNDAGTVDVAADPPSGSFLSFMITVQNTDATQ